MLVNPEPFPWNDPEKDPLTPAVTIKEPVIPVFVFIWNPEAADIEAVAVVLAICDKFNPTIPDAGIFTSPEPSPKKDPEACPAADILYTVLPADCSVNALPKVATEAVTVPDWILSVVVVAVVVIAASFNVALP